MDPSLILPYLWVLVVLVFLEGLLALITQLLWL